MKNNTKRLVAIVGSCLALIMPISRAFAQAKSVEQLRAEWWQWALSISDVREPSA
jgi:hypothetical protein